MASRESLSWGPGERAAAKQVDVEMVHGLPAVFAGVDDGAIALGEALASGDLGGDPEQVAEEGARRIFLTICHGNDVLARGDEDVDRRLRVDVREGVAQIVLINGCGRNASVNDFAE